VFGSTELKPDTEFHSSPLYNGKFPFKGMEISKRIQLLIKLVDILAANPVIKRVYAQVVTSNLQTSKKPHEIAFAFLCERVQMLVKPETTILIGDQDDEQFKKDDPRFLALSRVWNILGLRYQNKERRRHGALRSLTPLTDASTGRRVSVLCHPHVLKKPYGVDGG
jgi:hypothetical protein